MVSTIANEDLAPPWSIQNEPIWICDHDKDCELEKSSSSSNYIAEPFLEHELEPHGQHDILVTLDVCAQVHATAHRADEGYDVQSINMVQVLKDNNHDNTFTRILEELSPDELSSQEQNQANKHRIEDDSSIGQRMIQASLVGAMMKALSSKNEMQIVLESLTLEWEKRSLGKFL